MSCYHRKTKTDANQPEIVEFLRAHGVFVAHVPGGVVPDLLCFFQEWGLLEIKIDNRRDAKYTRTQLEFIAGCKGLVGIAKDKETALRFAKEPRAYALTQKQKDNLGFYLISEPKTKKVFTVQQIEKVLEV